MLREDLRSRAHVRTACGFAGDYGRLQESRDHQSMIEMPDRQNKKKSIETKAIVDNHRTWFMWKLQRESKLY